MNDYRQSKEFSKDKVDLAILLTELRTAKGWSIRELSALSGIAPYNISNIETNKQSPSFFTMSKVFNALGYSVGEAYSLLPNALVVLD